MLMVSGFDRYYQITKCFRDEDLRADRQPEFTQIDCETSFLTEVGDPRDVRRHDPQRVQGTAISVDLPPRSRCMTYDEAMRRYGSDKPDLRVKLEFTDLDRRR